MLLLLFAVGSAWAQERTVRGTVTGDGTGETLPGVNVFLKGTSTGVVTDIDGVFTINVPGNNAVLVFSFIGLETKEVAVGARSIIDVELSDASQQLSEVVVVGYGTQSAALSTQSVSTIKSDAFENFPIMTAADALQGQAAGVQMTGASGVIGSQPNVRVRGVASITGGSQPLYVVDGVPMNDASGAAYSSTAGSPVALNPLQELNPNEIESITVLKDASAVAIYGSRGANGVILIETKKGKAGKTQINVEHYQGVSEPTVIRPYMSRQQYDTYGQAYFGDTPEEWNDFIGGAFGPSGLEGFDWVDAVTNQGSIQNTQLSASGGNEKTKFFLSGTYFTQDAYTIANEVERFNGRLNVSHQINDRARLGANIGMSALFNDRINSDNSTFAPQTGAFLQLPYVTPRLEDGSFRRTGFIPNFLALEETSFFEYITRRSTANVFFEYDILPGLTFKTDFGVDLFQSEESTRYADIITPGGSASKFIRQDNKFLTTNTLNYEWISNDGDHYFSALAGQSYEQADFNSIGVAGTGFVSDGLPNTASAATPTTTTASWTGWSLFSLFSRANYRYQNKYLFEASLRRDGSSRFGENSRYGNFYAVSGGWIISEESFFNSSVVDFLKLNASYGTAGNDRIGNFSSLGLYGAGALGDYAGNPGLFPSQAANVNLGWEETAQLDITLTTSMFNNRLNVEASVYDKTTTGLLLNVPLPFTTGFPNFTENAGEMRNRGIDLMINTKNIETGDFSWSTSFNIGFLENEVLSLPGANLDDEGREFIANTASQRAIVGHPINTFYLIRANGVNPETGDHEWLDINGDPTLSPLASDRVIAGQALPTYTGGLTNNFRYRNFDLSVFFTFVGGNSIMYDDLRFMYSPANVLSFNLDPRILDFWQQPGDQAFAPSMSSPTRNTFAQRSTQQLIRGDYFRLRNLTLGYSVPKSVLDRTFLTKARVYVQLQNWFTFFSDAFDLGLEPEVNDGGGVSQFAGESFFTPNQARMATGGVSFSF